MSERAEGPVAVLPSNGVKPTDKIATSGTGSFVPQAALDAADAKIATWSGVVIDAADTIERLLNSESLPVPEAARDLVRSTTQHLRSLGTAASEQQAADLVAGLQRTAAANPAASIGVGAAVGAALAVLLVRLGSSGSSERPQSDHFAKPKT
jgi:ElaB/YqjD/DUF883 family membrane-anchored ribosome-binding protein